MSGWKLIRALAGCQPTSAVRVVIGDQTYRVKSVEQKDLVILMGYDEDSAVPLELVTPA